MSKRNKIIYWIATLWAALGMTSTATVQVFRMKASWDYVTHLGYPAYFLTLLGIWKYLGVVALLVPKYPLVKEWAYAGFFFAMTGAMYSHITMGDPVKDIFPSFFLLVLILLSWYFRPTDRKILFVNS